MNDRRRKFENLFSYLKSSKDFDKLSLKEIMWRIYNQACIDCGMDSVDVPMDEVVKYLENSMFIDFIQDCLLNPSDKPLPQNDYVKVTYKCSPEDKLNCIAWPDRCEDVGGSEDGQCSTIINISKLCGIESNKMEKVDDKILTAKEVEELANALKNNI